LQRPLPTFESHNYNNGSSNNYQSRSYNNNSLNYVCNINLATTAATTTSTTFIA